ncbi:MAG: hypothetical protein O7H41_18255 [Planctomycetota bacterium]|nr:hypothetical protein [Planctomycetota bacterium]
MLDGEYRLTKGFSVGASAGFYGYRAKLHLSYALDKDGSRDAFEEEDGTGVGVMTNLRWYVSRDPFQGLYFGWGGGVYYGRWDREVGAFRSGDTGEGAIFDLHTTLGYSQRIGDSFYIGPEAIGGYWFVFRDSSGSGSLDLFGGIGLRAGFAF